MAATDNRPRRAAPAPRRSVLPPPVEGAIVDLRSVTKRYSKVDIGVEDVTFAVQPGEFVFIVGASGSGKSTLVRLLIKESEPTFGSITVAGHDLGTIPRSKIPYYRRNVGVIFQDFKLLPNRTVHDNVAYALQVTGGKRREIREKVPDILRLTGLSTKLHNYPDQLSGGEQQRVSVARAFVNHPQLLLADEPTGNLDPETSIGIMQLLYRINRTGTTVIVATHDKAMVDRMRRRVIELSGGHVIRDEATGLATRDEVRLLLPRGGAGADAQRGAVVRRDGDRARHRARARRLHPRRAGHHRRRQRGALARDRRRLPESRTSSPPTSRACAGSSRTRRRTSKRVLYIPKEKAIAAERKAGRGDYYDLLGRQPAARHVPRSIPTSRTTSRKIRNALAPLSPSGGRTVIDPSIDEVRNREEDTNKILSATRVVKITMALLAVLLCVASILLIANTIRLSLYARRREVEVMKLVGATDWFIRWPFVLEGVLVGALGGILAILLLGVVKVALVDPLAAQFALIAAPDTINFGLLIARPAGGVGRRLGARLRPVAAALPARLSS